MLGAKLIKNNSNIWNVWINEKQDYETPSMQNYRFSIIIEYETYVIALNIINIDDNAPVIQANERSCEIEENYSGKTNCTYTISDADGWINDVSIEFTSVPEEGVDNFKLTNGTQLSEYKKIARLEIIKQLDFEIIPVYMLMLTATDTAKNKGTLMSVVQVIDMPDEPPSWTRITAAENIFEKTNHTFTVSAVDGDIQINAEINYKIIPEIDNESHYFEIDAKSGIVKIHPIDRDTLKKEIFRFSIVAYEKLNTTSAIEANILIILEDKNDHKPQITPDVLKIDIKEETYMSLEFNESIIGINDPDLAENGQYSVKLTDSEYNWSSAFLIVPNNGYQSGNFTITIIDASLLDYEDENWRNIEINIVATEVANPSHIDTRKIEINLINWNDEMPIFNNTNVKVEIKEDVEINFIIAEIFATDRDIDDKVTHSIVGQKLLKINETTGVIKTAQNDALDYESIPVVIVQVLATDLANHVAYATLTIHVIDVNDVPPKLYLPKQIPSLLEEVENGTRVDAIITASDPDTEAKLVFNIDWSKTTAHKRSVLVNESYYRQHLDIITEYPDKLNTREAIGIIITKDRIDYEAFDVIFITIVVTDTTTVHNDNSTFASLTLNIIDCNDNFPIFNKFENMSVSENQITDTLIGAVTATDADGPEFNKISYDIAPINNTESYLIKIDSTSGIIRVDTDKAIDAEKYEYIYYSIVASDGENNTTMTLAIFVIDVNDEEPYLSPDKIFNSTIHIMEKTPNNTLIYQIYSQDNDRTHPFNNVSYNLNANQSAAFHQYFNLDKFSGLLSVNLRDGYILDRDYGASSYTLNIKLRDNYLVDDITWNTNTFDTTMTIILDDINDQIPELPDLGDPAKVITENTKRDSLILSIEASDHDDPETDNTKITYKLLEQYKIINNQDSPSDNQCNNNIDPFKLVNENLKRAHIFANDDLKGCYGTWQIKVYAQDKGQNPGPLNDTKIYNIKISDYNYYDPVIVIPAQAGSGIPLSQEQSLHTQLKTYDKQLLSNFKASDNDSGDSGKVTFTITSLTGDDDDDKYFDIINLGDNEAQLQLKSWPSNIEENNKYKINLIASDHGDPPRNSTIQEHTIIFVSTQGPKFNDNQWMIWIKENKTGLNYSQKIPEAFDDLNDNGNFVPIYYFIDDKAGDYEYFKIDMNTRLLTLVKELDREKKDTMWINIITTADANGPPRDPREQAILNITIIVLDENDNPPIFESKFYSGGVAVEDQVDRVIMTIKATDADLNDTLSYTIIPESMMTSDNSISAIKNPFLLDSISGELLLKFSVTSEMIGFFKFNTTVVDAVDHSDTSIIQVYIVSQTNRVVFTFKNSPANVKEQRIFLKNIFTDSFGYLCNIDDIKISVDNNNNVLDNVTTVTTHFINSNDNLPIESETIIRLSSDLQTVTSLKASLQAKSLYLIDVPTGSLTDTSDPQEKIYWFLVTLCVFFSFSTVVLLFIYFWRTKILRQRLDKMALEWQSQDQNEKINKPVVTPGTNQFSIVGSNPIWKIDGDDDNNSKTNDNIIDNISQRSGDSDLIGIEDNLNFSYLNDAFNLPKEFKPSQVNDNVPQTYINAKYYEDKC
ncbi:protocadherin Fat 1-like isoform X2 [Aphidius gifuensis]|nr:protocadherin Fat 1-like isoform X2 [Aphidius gifuensis]